MIPRTDLSQLHLWAHLAWTVSIAPQLCKSVDDCHPPLISSTLTQQRGSIQLSSSVTSLVSTVCAVFSNNAHHGILVGNQ